MAESPLIKDKARRGKKESYKQQPRETKPFDQQLKEEQQKQTFQQEPELRRSGRRPIIEEMGEEKYGRERGRERRDYDQERARGGGYGGKGREYGEYRREYRKPSIEVMEESPSLFGGVGGMGSTAGLHPSRFVRGGRRESTRSSYGGYGSEEEWGEGRGEERLGTAAKELGAATWQKALEVKDSTVQMASNWRSILSERLPFIGVKKGGRATWELYGRKKRQCSSLVDQAEMKLREARDADPDRAAELQLQATVLRQKALKKAQRAQQLADEMKGRADQLVDEYKQPTYGRDKKRLTAWELYGSNKQKASKLFAQAEAKEQEASAISDHDRARELYEEAERLKERALAKAEEAQAYADGIKRAADDKVEELRRWALQSDEGGGSGRSRHDSMSSPYY